MPKVSDFLGTLELYEVLPLEELDQIKNMIQPQLSWQFGGFAAQTLRRALEEKENKDERKCWWRRGQEPRTFSQTRVLLAVNTIKLHAKEV